MHTHVYNYTCLLVALIVGNTRGQCHHLPLPPGNPGQVYLIGFPRRQGSGGVWVWAIGGIRGRGVGWWSRGEDGWGSHLLGMMVVLWGSLQGAWVGRRSWTHIDHKLHNNMASRIRPRLVRSTEMGKGRTDRMARTDHMGNPRWGKGTLGTSLQ